MTVSVRGATRQYHVAATVMAWAHVWSAVVSAAIGIVMASLTVDDADASVGVVVAYGALGVALGTANVTIAVALLSGRRAAPSRLPRLATTARIGYAAMAVVTALGLIAMGVGATMAFSVISPAIVVLIVAPAIMSYFKAWMKESPQ